MRPFRIGKAFFKNCFMKKYQFLIHSIKIRTAIKNDFALSLLWPEKSKTIGLEDLALRSK